MNAEEQEEYQLRKRKYELKEKRSTYRNNGTKALVTLGATSVVINEAIYKTLLSTFTSYGKCMMNLAVTDTSARTAISIPYVGSFFRWWYDPDSNVHSGMASRADMACLSFEGAVIMVLLIACAFLSCCFYLLVLLKRWCHMGEIGDIATELEIIRNKLRTLTNEMQFKQYQKALAEDRSHAEEREHARNTERSAVDYARSKEQSETEYARNQMLVREFIPQIMTGFRDLMNGDLEQQQRRSEQQRHSESRVEEVVDEVPHRHSVPATPATPPRHFVAPVVSSASPQPSPQPQGRRTVGHTAPVDRGIAHERKIAREQEALQKPVMPATIEERIARLQNIYST